MHYIGNTIKLLTDQDREIVIALHQDCDIYEEIIEEENDYAT